MTSPDVVKAIQIATGLIAVLFFLGMVLATAHMKAIRNELKRLADRDKEGK